MQSFLQGFEERLAANGFAQVSDASCLRGLLADGRGVMRRDEDDRGEVAQLTKPSLQFHPGHAAELNVEHQAFRPGKNF